MERNDLHLSIFELELCIKHLKHQLSLYTAKSYKSRTHALRMAARIESLTKLGLLLVRGYRRQLGYDIGFADAMSNYFDAVLTWVNGR